MDLAPYTGEHRMLAFVEDAAEDMRSAREELEAALEEVPTDGWKQYVPYGDLTIHDLLAHIAAADQTWAIAAQGLLKGESDAPTRRSPAPEQARARAILRGRGQSPEALREEMRRRRRLLLTLYELLQERHLAMALPLYGARHNSVRERIWRGYHDRMHAEDIRRALRMNWHPQRLRVIPELARAFRDLAPEQTQYVIHSVDPVMWEKPSPLTGWTYRTLLAHIASGDWVLQTHLRRLAEDGRVAKWPDVDAGNAERVAERERVTSRALAEEYLSMRHETLRLIAKLKAKHLNQPIRMAWLPPGEHTVLDYLTGFHQHDALHREQLRGAMRHVRAFGAP